jgi:hypothetical protein
MLMAFVCLECVLPTQSQGQNFSRKSVAKLPQVSATVVTNQHFVTTIKLVEEYGTQPKPVRIIGTKACQTHHIYCG